ncbi:MAG: hypothetical protein MPJ25_10670 [Pirellulales bacterium]|nr:hypothetical protein [Pirellulales bacterium]
MAHTAGHYTIIMPPIPAADALEPRADFPDGPGTCFQVLGFHRKVMGRGGTAPDRIKMTSLVMPRGGKILGTVSKDPGMYFP